MTVIKFEDVSKRYKLYSKGGLYMRDRLTHALQRFVSRVNGAAQHSGKREAQSADPGANSSPPVSSATPSARVTSPLALGTAHVLERDFWALKNVSFEIKEGESVGFIGRNGAGKSTILKLLAGVTKPSSGMVEVNGKVAAMIEVGAGFHPELTGRENIYLNGSILGMTKAEIDDKFDSIVGYAELEDFIDTPVKHYSSGMYIRLGFAIAAHTNPDMYLIDEVLSVGDEGFQKKCLATLAAHKQAGKTIILVSHALEKVEEVCDRVIYVDHGEIRYDGIPELALEQYRSSIARQYSNPAGSIQHEGGAQIVDLVLLTKTGNQTFKFHTGEDIIIQILYAAKQPLESIRLGIAITGSKGEYVSGFTTKATDERFTKIVGNGTVYCRLPSIPLRAGEYSASVAMHYDTYATVIARHTTQFRITGNDSYAAGLVRLNEEWSRDWSPTPLAARTDAQTQCVCPPPRRQGRNTE